MNAYHICLCTHVCVCVWSPSCHVIERRPAFRHACTDEMHACMHSHAYTSEILLTRITGSCNCARKIYRSCDSIDNIPLMAKQTRAFQGTMQPCMTPQKNCCNWSSHLQARMHVCHSCIYTCMCANRSITDTKKDRQTNERWIRMHILACACMCACVSVISFFLQCV